MRDEHGLEPMDHLFSSPEKPKNKHLTKVNGNGGGKNMNATETSEEEDMDIDDSMLISNARIYMVC